MDLSDNKTALLLKQKALLEDRLDIARRTTDRVLHRIQNELSSSHTLVKLINEKHMGETYREEAVSRLRLSHKNLLSLCKNYHAYLDLLDKPDPYFRARLSDLLHAVLADHEGMLSGSGIELITDFGKNSHQYFFVNGLQAVFSELINNVCKFCNRGSSLTIRIRHKSGHYGVHFIDTGPGIHPAIQEELFGGVCRTVDEHNSPRLGFGLLFCYLVLTGHEGKIRLVRSDDTGTHIELIIPVRLQDEAE